VRQRFVDLAHLLIAAATAHAYLTLFLAISVEEAGIPLPIPGDLIIAYYGWRAAFDPFETVRTILTCALASTVGTQLPYWLARRWGRRVTERVAYWLDFDPAKIERVFVRFGEHGFRDVLIARLIPGLRVAVALVAGTAGVRWLQFSSGVFVAAAIYWTLWVLLGALLGPAVVETLSPSYLRVIIFAIPVVLVATFITRFVIASRRRARAASAAP
jgi:membrane protein DedA with SNARE-associated domain